MRDNDDGTMTRTTGRGRWQGRQKTSIPHRDCMATARDNNDNEGGRLIGDWTMMRTTGQGRWRGRPHRDCMASARDDEDDEDNE
jgi:hypothetical protein